MSGNLITSRADVLNTETNSEVSEYNYDCITQPTPLFSTSLQPPEVINMNDVINMTVIEEKLVGVVKWFNSRSGYGFITVCDGVYAGKDIFVHYSSIDVVNIQYKYLIQGEYVEFTLMKSNNSEHEYHATHVGGTKYVDSIRRSAILCEKYNLNVGTKLTSHYSDKRFVGDRMRLPNYNQSANQTRKPYCHQLNNTLNPNLNYNNNSQHSNDKSIIQPQVYSNLNLISVENNDGFVEIRKKRSRHI